jgi:4-hydroxybenzoate polyprenyltransferase
MPETPKSEILPDARPDNWVDRFAPEGLRPWLKLGRFDRPTGIWLLMLPGWQGVALATSMAGRWPDLLLLAKIFAGAALMRAAGGYSTRAAMKLFNIEVRRVYVLHGS